MNQIPPCCVFAPETFIYAFIKGLVMQPGPRYGDSDRP